MSNNPNDYQNFNQYPDAPQQPPYPPQQPQYPPQQPQYPFQQPQYPSQQPQYPSQQPQYPSQQPQYPPQQQLQPPPYPYAQYPVPQPPQKSTSVYGVLSIVLGVLGYCCSIFTAIPALILGLIGLKKQRGNIACILGISLSAIFIIYFIYMIVNFILHPELLRDTLDNINKQLNQ